MTSNRLYYAHDPMCSWCWGFRPVWEQLTHRLPSNVRTQRLLGGLAPDNNQPMSEQTRERIQDTWRRIEQRIPGTEFNFDFWEKCQPRRSTYPACRAVIAAGRQGEKQEERMILAILSKAKLDIRSCSTPKITFFKTTLLLPNPDH